MLSKQEKECIEALINIHKDLKELENRTKSRGEELVKTNNRLKEKAINIVSNMSNDKIEEFIDIIEIVSANEIEEKDIRNIKSYVLWYPSEKLKKKKKIKKELY